MFVTGFMPTAKQPTSRYKRKEITRTFLKGLLLTGAVYIAASSPYFVLRVMQRVLSGELSLKDFKDELNTKEKKQFSDTFSYLKRKGMITITYKNNQAYI